MNNSEIKFKYENLYQFRKEKGLSQEELGDIIGVSRQAVSKWETGERSPDLNNLVALCKEFDKTFEDFIDITDDNLKEDKKNKKFNLKKILKTFIIILLDLYLLTAVFKLAVFGLIFLKTNKYKDSNNYSYNKKEYSYNETYYTEDDVVKKGDVIESYTIMYKDKNQRVSSQTQYLGTTVEYYYSDRWACKINDTIPNAEVFYISYSNIDNDSNSNSNSNSYYKWMMGAYRSSPYEAVSEEIEKLFNLSYILNPFKIIKVDFEKNDLIFERYEIFHSSVKYDTVLVKTYIDTKTGLLSKTEIYKDIELLSQDVYYDYEFGEVEDGYVSISDEQKEEIRVNAKRQLEELNAEFNELNESYEDNVENENL